MAQENKLLYIVNIDFPPMSGPGVWRMLALAKYAALAGHRVHVFCADRSFWHSRFDHKLLDQLPGSVKVTRIGSIYENDMLDKLEHWRKSSSPIKHKIGAQLYWWVQRYYPDQIVHWVIKATAIICFKGLSEKPDAIVTTGPMHLVHVAGFALSGLKKTTWVMDYRDPWTGDPAYGQVHPGPYQEQFMTWLERRLVRKATWVTAVTPGFLAPIVRRFATGPDVGKFKVIANGHDMEIAATTSPPAIARSNHLVIHFNGTIQEGNDAFESLLKAIARFRKKFLADGLPEILLSFCGTNRRVREQAENLGISDWLHDYGALSQTRSQEISGEADVLLVAARADLVTSRGIVPAKLYEALALGKPILALVPEPSDVRDILSEDIDSVCVDPRLEDDILQALDQLAIRKRDGTRNQSSRDTVKRAALARRYSRRILCADMLRLVGFGIPDPLALSSKA
jgi:glycosyltransferase involved in cell wall biosynthesis